MTIASQIPLIDLPPGSGEPDVEVLIGTIDDAPAPTDSWEVIAAPGEVRGWAPATGAFRVRAGREIMIEPIANADERTVRLAIVGPLLGVVLAQRGAFVLHASTVVINGRAAAFFGPSGRGKSTLTAALASAGHSLLADDMTVIDTSGKHPLVKAGFPRVKLWPDSAAALEHDLDSLPLIHPDRSKRSVQLSADFQGQSVELARCYLLEDGAVESVDELLPTESMLSLVKCTYQANWLHPTGASAANLGHCAALSRSGVVRRLRRRRSFEALKDVVRFIEGDVQAAD